MTVYMQAQSFSIGTLSQTADGNTETQTDRKTSGGLLLLIPMMLWSSLVSLHVVMLGAWSTDLHFNHVAPLSDRVIKTDYKIDPTQKDYVTIMGQYLIFYFFKMKVGQTTLIKAMVRVPPR